MVVGQGALSLGFQGDNQFAGRAAIGLLLRRWESYSRRARFRVTSLNAQPLGFKASDIKDMRVLTLLLTTAGLACSAGLAAKPATTRAGGPPMAQVASEMKWRMIGPFRGGRTRAVTGVATQPAVFYIGAVNGGVWKTDDAGHTWHSVFDEQPTQSIGSIVVAPSDPNIVYIGSGEGQHRPDLSVGDGIYKSTDAGKTWTHLGLRDGQQNPRPGGRSDKPGSRLRRRTRPSLWPQCRTWRVPLARRRQDLGTGVVQG